MFFVYELFQTLCFFILRFVAIFTGPGKFAKFAAFKDNSEFLRRIDEAAATLEAMGADKPECVWLHVASAGELEQAVPILRAIAELGKIVFFVSYFSPDTEPFLKNVPALLCAVGFPADVRSNHEHVIRSLGIRRIFLVRYDFWPAFLHSAKRAKVEINLLAATSNNARNNLASTLFGHWKAFAYSYFSNIFVVADSDVAFFQKLAPLAKVHLAGDPKWYRAKERATALSQQGVFTRFGAFAHFCFQQKSRCRRMCFVFGSPHAEEHQIALDCARLEPLPFLLYVPHEVSAVAIAGIVKSFRKEGVEAKLYSELITKLPTGLSSHESLRNEQHPIDERLLQDTPVVVFDRVGSLAELYALADVAIVGGGFDGQIHNSLEPAAHPVATIFGGELARAAEARVLVEKGAGLSFDRPEEMFQFLSQCAKLSLEPGKDLSSLQKLAQIRLKALELFKRIPNTSTVVIEALFRK